MSQPTADRGCRGCGTPFRPTSYSVVYCRDCGFPEVACSGCGAKLRRPRRMLTAVQFVFCSPACRAFAPPAQTDQLRADLEALLATTGLSKRGLSRALGYNELQIQQTLDDRIPLGRRKANGLQAAIERYRNQGRPVEPPPVPEPVPVEVTPGCTYDEVAERLQMTVGEVHSLVVDGRLATFSDWSHGSRRTLLWRDTVDAEINRRLVSSNRY